jgi:hypothetical protein
MDYRWEVETRRDRREVEASSPNEALRLAWKLNPPEEIGLLVRLRARYAGEKYRSFKKWNYIAGEVAAKIAGYKVMVRASQ